MALSQQWSSISQFAQICPCLSLTSPLKLLQPRGDGLLVQHLQWAESRSGMFVHTVAHNLISPCANWFPAPLANRPNKAGEGLSVWCGLGTLEQMQRARLLMKLLSAEGHGAGCSGDEPSALGHFGLLLCFSLSFSQTGIISKVSCSIIKVYKNHLSLTKMIQCCPRFSHLFHDSGGLQPCWMWPPDNPEISKCNMPFISEYQKENC